MTADVDSAAVQVTDAPEKHRFEARIDGELAGVLTYLRSDDLVVYPHTKVQAAFEGRGIGGALTRSALDDARARGLKVDPECSFVAAWIARHPEYRDLVVGGH